MDCDKANDLDFFEAFAELNIMDDLLKLNNLSIYQISYAIIQSLSFILVNISNTQFLFYIFSNNAINDIISIEISNFDDEYLSYYINFLKSLSLRVDCETIQFFFDENTNTFPIVEFALKLYNYSNSMISTVVHNIILAILNVGYEPIQEYFCKLPTVSYFILIVCHLRDDSRRYFEDETDYEAYEDMIDDIMYINDILSIGIEKINYILINALFYYFIMPKIMIEIFNENNSTKALIMLIALFKAIKDESFLNILFIVCFSPSLSQEILDFCSLNEISVKNYRFKWNEQVKMKITFKDFVINNYSNNFFKGLRYQTCSIYKKVKEYKELKSVQKGAFLLAKKHKNENKVDYKDIEKLVLSSFKENDMKVMSDYHYKLSISLGVKVGMFYVDFVEDLEKENKIDLCFWVKMKNFMTHLIPKQKITNNPIRMKLITMIYNEDRPQNEKVLALSHFLLWVILNQANISRELLSQAKLKKILIKNYKNENIEIIENIFNNLLKLDFTISENEDKELEKFFSFENNFFFISRNSFFPNITKDTNNNELIEKILKILTREQESTIELIELLSINLNNFCIYPEERTIQLIKEHISIIQDKINKLNLSKEKLSLIYKKCILRYINIIQNKDHYENYLKRVYNIMKFAVNEDQKGDVLIQSYLLIILNMKNIINRLQNKDEITKKINIVGIIYNFEEIKNKKYEYLIYKTDLIIIGDIFIYLGKYKVKQKKEYFEISYMNYINEVKCIVIQEKKSIILGIDKNKVIFENNEDNNKNIENIQNIIKKKKNNSFNTNIFNIDYLFNE